MRDRAVFTTAMSSMSIIVAADTTARVQRWVVLIGWEAPGEEGREGVPRSFAAGGRSRRRVPPCPPVRQPRGAGAAGSTAARLGRCRRMSTSTETLRSVPLFSGLSNRDLKDLAEVMQERTAEAGKELLSEGEGGVGFFVILDGTATVNVGGREAG